MNTTTAPAARVDRDGFPVTDCRRCGGSGRFSFNQLDGDRCYGCSGSGLVWKGAKVKAAAIALAQARRGAKQVIVRDAAPGDVVALSRGQWIEIAAIEVDRSQPTGWTVHPDGTREETAWRCTIVAADGARYERQTNLILPRRAAVIDVAPYLAAAGL